MDGKKTQKIVVVVLIVTALLGIAGALLVYYLSTQDEERADTRRDREYCACITAYTTPECNDCSCTQIESQALDSKIGEVVDGVCSLDCDVDTEEAETIECLISPVRESTCHSVSVRNLETRDLIIPPIPTDRPVLLTANFVPREITGEKEEFTKFEFIINGVTQEVQASSAPSTMINGQETHIAETEFSNFQDIDTLTLQAISYSDKDPDGGSPDKYCHRQYNLTDQSDPLCSNMIATIDTGPEANTTVINQLELNTPNLVNASNISINFTFDDDNINDVQTENITGELLEEILVNEKIFLEYEHLYSSPELYSNQEGFPALNAEEISEDSLRISAQVYANNSQIDSATCRDTVTLLTEIEETPEPEPEPTPEEPIPATDIQLTMEGPACVNKDDIANYRITVTNGSENPEGINNITNKLPLGFQYVEGSTIVNGASVQDDILEVTSIGESQELIWDGDWAIEAGSTLTIGYATNVTENALYGENQNEAVVEPTTVPDDMDGLRAEFVTLISDECEEEDLPDTANFTIVSFLAGTLALIFGILVYQGRVNVLNQAMFKVINSKPVKKRLMSPQDYFEDNILEEDEEEEN